ncbi:Oligopeptide-binding protein AppA precursor [Mucisphaera calidilacus]|uniref:Oligopeptide-binding protein AppA n=2 Tax=Mucisphaera calidilacus TaxID=2527982 RepID=A0A518BVJ2_9BACT|nr:Oligopeptide-binding protein AppA precursor [Mucisphaera calidilacus]
MDQGFRFKDVLVIVLLVGVLVTLWVGMIQNDRQWSRLNVIEDSISNQTKDLTAIRQQIAELPARGAVIEESLATTTAAPDDNSPFRRLRAVKQRPDYAQGDWLVDAFQSEVPKINELTSGDVYSRVVYTKVLEPLATYDLEKRELVPLLAEGWQMADDGLSVTVRLRRNVTFSNGDPMTADDVVYSFGLIRNANIVDGRLIQYYRHITGCEKIDDYTVRIDFEKVFYENLYRAVFGIMIHSKKFLSQYTDEQIRQHPALLLGTGPYRIADPTRYTPGETIVLLRNDRYWGVSPSLDRIVYRIIQSDQAMDLAFRNGEIDLHLPTPEQHLALLEDPVMLDRTQHFVYEQIRSGYRYIAWNQVRGGEPTLYADRRVRQALTMLLDRERVCEEIFLGFSTVTSGPFHEIGDQDDPSIEPWPYDPDRAIALLEEAGFRRDDKGTMLTPEGEPFKIQITYPAGSDLGQKIMLAFKDQYALAGINLELNPQKWALLLQSMNSKDFEAITLGWGAGGFEGDIEQMFHSRNIPNGDNRNAYSNPDLDALIEKAHVTLDREERMEIWRQCHRILHEDQPYTFLFRSKVRFWLDDRFANVHEMPVVGMNYTSTWPVPIEWYVPAEMQFRQ